MLAFGKKMNSEMWRDPSAHLAQVDFDPPLVSAVLLAAAITYILNRVLAFG
jgi:hypothetical protein